MNGGVQSEVEIYSVLARTLITLRRRAGYTQSEVADMLHISRQAYSYYENCRRIPSVAVIVKLSHIYQVPIDEMFDGSF